MALAKPEEDQIVQQKDTPEMELKDLTNTQFKLNAQAPEFVPRSQTQMPISSYFYPCFHFLSGNNGGSEWIYLGGQDQFQLISDPSFSVIPDCSKNFLTNDLRQKIIRQAEYQFSDMSLLANESLAKHMNKDPEGFVPLSIIASSKRIKSLVTNNHLLAQALQSSSKLIVSNDGKKVKRKHLFTERDKEELQSRTVVAENLPDDHSHQNLEKIFGVVGRMKTIRICHPQESNASRNKGEFFFSNKLHALVEYETVEIAEKAVDKLNDERNWRKGLRVRLLLRCSPKSVLKNRKSDFDMDEDDLPPEASEDSAQAYNQETAVDNTAEETAGTKKGWARGRGKPKGRAQNHGGRGLLAPPAPLSSFIQSEASTKQTTKGPRMPDGTRGFTMGRGKPITPPSVAAAGTPSE
ncbi:Ataxin-2, C-terminal [Dillenia turbinata]|uniref:Ataxin-2, C-terminal n=1 Tax=Dillenia turbinata TaxID=194707 RepID=A0AAN8ZQB1_9MAGN